MRTYQWKSISAYHYDMDSSDELVVWNVNAGVPGGTIPRGPFVIEMEETYRGTATVPSEINYYHRNIHIDTNVLASLVEAKSILSAHVTELTELAAGYQVQALPTIPSGDITLIDVTAPSVAGTCTSPVTYPSGICSRCGSSAGFFETCVGAGCVCIGSAWCPFCGAGYFGHDNELDSGFFLKHVKNIVQTEQLLSIVIAAIVVFFHLRRIIAVIPFSIAVAQREFFTRHGSHPPKGHYLGSTGLFLGRGFQPENAA